MRLTRRNVAGQASPTVWHSDQTYVETDQALGHTETHEWNHGLGEVISALLAYGLHLTMLVEHQSIPWEALPGQMDKGATANGAYS